MGLHPKGNAQAVRSTAGQGVVLIGGRTIGGDKYGLIFWGGGLYNGWQHRGALRESVSLVSRERHGPFRLLSEGGGQRMSPAIFLSLPLPRITRNGLFSCQHSVDVPSTQARTLCARPGCCSGYGAPSRGAQSVGYARPAAKKGPLHPILEGRPFRGPMGVTRTTFPFEGQELLLS